jgi:hypothetical protein
MRPRLPQRSAARGIAICLFALALASLLNAEGLRKTAEIQPQGARRHLALDVTRPLVDVSRFLHLSTPRHELQLAIGREHEDEVDTQVHLTLPPPAGPVAGHERRTRASALEPPTTESRRARAAPAHRHPRRSAVARRPSFTHARPLRLWVAGDSLAEVPGQALERVSGHALDVVGVESRLATGLTRPDLYNWFTRIEQVRATLHPDVAVFSFGADDAHDYMAGVPDGRQVGPLGSPSWVAEYRRRADGVTRELNAAGVFVVWLGLPIPDGPGFKRSFPVVNRILASVARAHARGSTFVDTWHMLDDAHGRYTPYLRVHGKLTLLRLPDGVHYTAAAGDLVAAETIKQLERHFAF